MTANKSGRRQRQTLPATLAHTHSTRTDKTVWGTSPQRRTRGTLHLPPGDIPKSHKSTNELTCTTTSSKRNTHSQSNKTKQHSKASCKSNQTNNQQKNRQQEQTEPRRPKGTENHTNTCITSAKRQKKTRAENRQEHTVQTGTGVHAVFGRTPIAKRIPNAPNAASGSRSYSHRATQPPSNPSSHGFRVTLYLRLFSPLNKSLSFALHLTNPALSDSLHFSFYHVLLPQYHSFASIHLGPCWQQQHRWQGLLATNDDQTTTPRGQGFRVSAQWSITVADFNSFWIIIEGQSQIRGHRCVAQESGHLWHKHEMNMVVQRWWRGQRKINALPQHEALLVETQSKWKVFRQTDFPTEGERLLRPSQRHFARTTRPIFKVERPKSRPSSTDDDEPIHKLSKWRRPSPIVDNHEQISQVCHQ